jgi:hypothetical protein
MAAMAFPAIPTLPPAVRATDFISAFISPTVPQSSTATFNRIVETARASAGPLPAQGLGNAVGQPDIVSLLDRSLFRDLVSNFEGITGVTTLPPSEGSLFAALGVDGLLGRTGLPSSLAGLDTRQALTLAAALTNFTGTLQALAGGDAAGPGIGSLLDVSA